MPLSPSTHSMRAVCENPPGPVHEENVCVPIDAGAVSSTHSPATAPADRDPAGVVVTVPEPVVGELPVCGPPQLLLPRLNQVAANVGPDVVKRMVPSVNVVLATALLAPVAVARYVAINVFGSWK